jgi:hypothetical protein
MASTGHTSTHARQSVHPGSATRGRRAAGDSALVGHVAMQTPHAVHDESMVTVT